MTVFDKGKACGASKIGLKEKGIYYMGNLYGTGTIGMGDNIYENDGRRFTATA